MKELNELGWFHILSILMSFADVSGPSDEKNIQDVIQFASEISHQAPVAISQSPSILTVMRVRMSFCLFYLACRRLAEKRVVERGFIFSGNERARGQVGDQNNRSID